MARVTLPVKAGDVLAIDVTVRDEDGSLVDLTGTWLAQARRPLDATLVATFTFEPAADQPGGGRGRAVLRATATESAKLTGGEFLDVEERTAGFTWLEFRLDVEPDMAFP
jgi:hypothetical protein